MTYEQKYGRLPDGLTDLETPPEDWQFENSTPVKITGRKEIEVPKLNLGAILPNKEVTKVKFTELSMDKQIKLVAEEYNKETSTSGMCDKFGIGSAKLYERIHEARDMGLITKLRSERKSDPQAGDEPVVAKDATTEMVISETETTTVEDFARVAEDKLAQAERLAKEAERLQQAGKIALAVEELLGDKAGRVVATLYEAINI